MMKNLDHLITECTEDQLRQYTDSTAAFRHLLAAKKEAAEVRGSMIWREVSGGKYLIRTSTTGAQHSLGRESDETVEMYRRFMDRKTKALATLQARKETLEQMRKLNRVFGVGRTPQDVVGVLNALAGAGIADQFMTVGTHAMYAYEAAAGVRVGSDALATRDIDLLFDTRRHVAFMSTLKRIDSSLIDVLRRYDKTFRVMDDQKQTAVNDKDFEVDIIRRVAIDGDPHPLTMSEKEGDLWAVQVSSGNRIISGRRFEQIVVSPRGEMALMTTVHPLDFIAVKYALSESKSRDPKKAPKDRLQAQVVEHLWHDVLVHTMGTSEPEGQAVEGDSADPLQPATNPAQQTSEKPIGKTPRPR